MSGGGFPIGLARLETRIGGRGRRGAPFRLKHGAGPHRAFDQMGLDYQVAFAKRAAVSGKRMRDPVPEMDISPSGDDDLRISAQVERVHAPRIRASVRRLNSKPCHGQTISTKPPIETVKRFLGKPGVAGFLVTSSRHKPVHANEYMRLYAILANRPVHMVAVGFPGDPFMNQAG